MLQICSTWKAFHVGRLLFFYGFFLLLLLLCLSLSQADFMNRNSPAYLACPVHKFIKLKAPQIKKFKNNNNPDGEVQVIVVGSWWWVRENGYMAPEASVMRIRWERTGKALRTVLKVWRCSKNSGINTIVGNRDWLKKSGLKVLDHIGVHSFLDVLLHDTLVL